MKSLMHYVCSYCGKSELSKSNMILHEKNCKIEHERLNRMECSVKKIRSQICDLEKDLETKTAFTDQKIKYLTEQALSRIYEELGRFDIYCLNCLDLAKPMRDVDGVEYCCVCKNADVLMRGYEIKELVHKLKKNDK